MSSETFSLGKLVGKEVALYKSENMERGVLMRKSPIFDGLSDTDCSRIAERGRLQCFARNDVLFTQGQRVQRLIIVTSGRVKLTHLNEHGSEIILALRGCCDALELPGLSDESSHHTLTAHAMVQGRALSWSIATMDEFKTAIPRLNANICRILTRELSDLRERYFELSSDKVDTRLAWTLIRLADQVGTQVAGGIEVSITRQELAQMIGTTLFTVSRVISKWGDVGLVVPLREAVLIPDPGRLRLVCSLEDKQSTYVV